jgi:hypothetical protein
MENKLDYRKFVGLHLKSITITTQQQQQAAAATLIMLISIGGFY